MLWDEPKIFFLERRYFFSIILSEFLKNRVALQQGQEEKFVNDVSELLEYLLQESVRLIGKAPDDMSKEDKMRALRFLDEKGALLITKSGTRICKFLGISKVTLYNYLDELRGVGNGNG